jgi:hypothetical protein
MGEGMLVLSGGEVVTMVVPAAGYFFMARVATQVRIDAQWLWLKVGQPFLESLPQGSPSQ